MRAGGASGASSAVSKIASRRSTASVRCCFRNRSIALSIVTLPGQAGDALGGGHLQDAVEVEVEPHDDLVAGVDVGQALDRELAHQGVVPRVLVLALEDADLGPLLAVDDGGEDLGPGGGQGGVALDDRGEGSGSRGARAASPSASMPRVCGVMSTRTGPTSTPAIRPPWTAAPIATARSGSISACTGRPSRSWSRRWTSGVRVAPPTSTTLSIWLACSLASESDWSRHVRVFASRGSISSSYSPRSISIFRCSGTPFFSAMNSSSIRATASNESVFLASSTARRTRLLATSDVAQVDAVLGLEPVADVVEEQLVEVVAAEVGVAVAGEDLDDAALDLRRSRRRRCRRRGRRRAAAPARAGAGRR